jgi:hypothetical protein
MATIQETTYDEQVMMTIGMSLMEDKIISAKEDKVILSKFNNVLQDLIKNFMVEDPCPYAIDKRIVNSIIMRRYFVISFYKGSCANDKIDQNYWKKVDYYYLPKTTKGMVELVWYEFFGKHMQLVN